MKFIVDAQLPKSLSALLKKLGEDAIHTLDLPEKNRTGDDIIIAVANDETRIVITKDNDFLQSHLLASQPPKLLLVSTGNIKNSLLLHLFSNNIQMITRFFEERSLIEITKEEVIVHS